MNNTLYPKLAVTNLKNNRKTYVPYIFTAVLCVMMFYMIDALSRSESVEEVTMQICLRYAVAVVMIFSLIFLFYTNSFLIKRRKKEIGVYHILGMGKSHISKMMLIEMLITAGVSIVAGIVFGVIFGKLMYLILLKILHSKVSMAFAISLSSVRDTVLLFVVIFLLSFLYNLLQIKLSNPIELLHGGNQGEKEPKTKWLLTLIGVAALGTGYYLAITTEHPLDALSHFFVAVVCVIVGTYALFTAGSIAILKMLKKNKKFYYQPKRFTTISGMIYRMKQNAVGLANICILSTMVLIMVSTTVSLYAGMEDILKARFPQDSSITMQSQDEKTKMLINELIDKTEKEGVKISSRFEYDYGALSGTQNGDTLNLTPVTNYGRATLFIVNLIPVEDYNRIEKKQVSLKDDEVMIYRTNGTYGENSVKINGRTYKIAQELNELKAEPKNKAGAFGTYYIICSSKEQVQKMLYEIASNTKGIEPEYIDVLAALNHTVRFNMSGDANKYENVIHTMQNEYPELSNVEFQNRQMSENSFYELYGSLLFIGIYMGILFVVATVLIIYYKQISEGYDDRERFQIMQKVGMSKKEVKYSIKNQVLSVFFLPLITAVIHVMVAFPVVMKLLALLNLANKTLFMLCTGVTIVAFAGFYAVVYGVTAREYYKIVN